MTGRPPAFVSGVVEGLIDEAVVRRLVEFAGGIPATIYGKQGKHHLLQHLKGYNRAARLQRWVVLVDLDQDADCAPPFRGLWLPVASPGMCFRVAVREIEAWLMADRDRFSGFIGTSSSRIPRFPDLVDDPKRLVVALALHSRSRIIREELTPRPGSGRVVGSAYTSRMIEYVLDRDAGWRPEVAMRASDSLRRCIVSLQTLITGRR